MTGPGRGVMLCDDLIFFSRVAATARAAGLEVKQVRSAAALLEAVKQDPPGGIIVDLHAAGLDVPALLAGLRTACPVMPRTIAFGSHVEAETLRAARAAGVDRVMPRSQFVKELEADLRAWLTPVGELS
ncbi:MAG: Response regulator receiver domain protein [Gemmataceae bacterium]|nr:Response regulator receiver domain protein [Gemmataceae bacterium]